MSAFTGFTIQSNSLQSANIQIQINSRKSRQVRHVFPDVEVQGIEVSHMFAETQAASSDPPVAEASKLTMLKAGRVGWPFKFYLTTSFWFTIKIKMVYYIQYLF